MFSESPLDTAECEGNNNKLHDETSRNPSISHPLLASRFSLQKQLTQGIAATAVDDPTSNLQRASRLATQQLADTLLEDYDMDKMDVR